MINKIQTLEYFMLAVCLFIGTLYSTANAAVTEGNLLAAVNAARAKPQQCPDGKTYPAVPALRANAALAAIAKTIGENGAPNTRPVLGKAGFLSFDARHISEQQGAVDAISIVNYWLKEPAGCPNCATQCKFLMGSYSDGGVGIFESPGWASARVLLMANPFDKAKIPEYRQRMFAELNRIRGTGIDAGQYPGAKCQSGAVAPMKWSDKLAEAAQFHSDDMAANGIPQDPHVGSAGDTPASRIKKHGCSGGSENVMYNFGSTPEKAVTGWIGLSEGHCKNLVRDAEFAALGIATSPKLETSGQGPFVTYNSAGACSAATFTRVDGGKVLAPGQAVISPNNTYKLIYQTDGNLVLYDNTGKPLWASATNGTTPGKTIMQTDGNFVVYDSNGTPRWASNTHGNPGAWLAVQNDGTLAIYGGNSALLWTSR